MTERTHSFTAILLAGDRLNDPLAALAPLGRKALLPVGGRSMILYMLETLQAARDVGDIVVVANNVGNLRDHPAVRAAAGSRVSFFEGAEGPSASVLKAVEALKLEGAVLVATADNPLLSSGTLDRFLSDAQGSGVSVLAGLARARDIRAVFPDVKRTFIKLSDGAFSGCNLFALMPGTAAAAAAAWMEIEDKRKRPLALIAHFGVFPLIAALFRHLSLAGAMHAVSETLGMEAGAVILDDPLAAMDVDRLDHVAIAEAVLSGALARA